MSVNGEQVLKAGLLSLDPVSVERISCFFDSYQDVFNLSLVCKKLEWMRYSPRIWSSVLNTQYGLNVTAQEFTPLKQLCQNMTPKYQAEGSQDSNEDQLLRFVGLYTDGGTDLNLMKYWLDYAFSPYDWLYYCSEVGQNINCVGVLGGLADGSHPLDAQYAEYRQSLVDVCQPLALHFLGDRLNTMSLHELEFTCREIGNAIEVNEAIAALVFQGLDWAQITERRNHLRQLTRQLSTKVHCNNKNILDYSAQKDIQNLHLLDTDNLAFVRDGSSAKLLASINNLSFQRNSNFTCPVATGVVFLGVLQNQCLNISPLDIYSKIQEMLDSKSCKMFDEMKKQPSAEEYPVVNSGASSAGCWSEFDVNWYTHQQLKNNSALCSLKPVAWFHFFNLQEALQYWKDYRKQKAFKSVIGGGFMSAMFGEQMPYNTEDQKDLQGREFLEVPLTQKWIGNVVVLKLIQCENLMELFNDNHPYPNIDIRDVKLQGRFFQLPNGVSIQNQERQ